MTLFTVDPALCLHDGACADECPRYVIEFTGDSVPAPAAGLEDSCMNCGHCVAVCPTGAFSLSTMPLSECAPVDRALLPSQAQVDHFLRSRRSIRTFRPQRVPTETLVRLLDLARYAPTGGNRQGVGWIVIQNPTDVRYIGRLALDWMRENMTAPAYVRAVADATERGLDLVCRNAPHLLIAHTIRGQETDGAVALAHLELAAYSLGLGACWSGFANNAIRADGEISRAAGIPEGRVSCGVMMVGFPEYEYHRIPTREAAKVEWR